MNRIKILRIFSRLNIGGPSIHTVLLTAGLNNDRFESYLVIGSEDTFEGNMLYLAEEKGVEPIVISEMGRNIFLLKDITALCRLYSLTKDIKPDIVHTHTAKAGLLGRSVALLINLSYSIKGTQRRLKLIHTFHGHILQGYFGIIKSHLFLWIERFLGYFTDKIITLSEKQKMEILRFRIGNDKKIVTVPLGLELKRFLEIDKFKGKIRNELEIDEETTLIGIIARLVPIKNHKMFIEGVSRFKKCMLKQKAIFLIIGDGELRKDLECLVREKKLEKDVLFLGFRKDLKNIYADLDLVVLTSLNEGTPVSLIEAQTAGIPVIATDVGGTSDLFTMKNVQGGSSRLKYCNEGILINSEDVDGLVMAIKELILNTDMLFQNSKARKTRVYSKYDISRLIKDMETVYKNEMD